MSDRKPRKVAIVGGGCAAMTAAWELTKAELDGQFEVTVYQLGWRLGGKGASGRGAGGRIEEHGLHLWMGHYDNAFRLMRECYEELGRDPKKCGIATWRDAFKPDPYVGLTDRTEEGDWRRLMAHFPPMKGSPGDPRPKGVVVTSADYTRRAVRLLAELIQSAATVDTLHENVRLSTEESAATSNGEPSSAEGAAAAIGRIVAYGQIVSLTALGHALGLLQIALERMPGIPLDSLKRFLDIISESVGRLLAPLLEGDRTAQYTWEIVDLVLAYLRGCVRFRIISDPNGFEAIDDYDVCEWMKLNGASERSIHSAFVRGLYDLAFAHEDGDTAKAGIAAGQGLRGGMRMFFGYREALFWKMQGGMGDIVFAPLYEVLKRRGVRFEFFHRLENVGIHSGEDGEPPHVTSLEFDVQARTTSGQEYAPLADWDGLPCWPADPDWMQLEDGERLQRESVQFESFWDRRRSGTRTLNVTRDFDFVVLGVSVGTIPFVCKEILATNERWRDMVENVKTVCTQSLQLWLKKDLPGLGWTEEPPNLSAYVEPFDTWADMSHLVPVENWPNDQAKSIGYFCNTLPCPPLTDADREDTDYHKRLLDRVRSNATRFLEHDIGQLWPKSVSADGSFDWDLLADPLEKPESGSGFAGKNRLRSQFWTANVNPSDRYVLALPGSLKYRISPLDNTYDNLTITGDWTDCGFNIGCVEAAVMSGRLAAHALSRYPALEDIDGYDHP